MSLRFITPWHVEALVSDIASTGRLQEWLVDKALTLRKTDDSADDNLVKMLTDLMLRLAQLVIDLSKLIGVLQSIIEELRKTP